MQEGGFCSCAVTLGDMLLQVAGEMASAGLQRMMDGYEREKACSDLDHPKGFICLSTTGFAGGAPKPEDSGMHQTQDYIICLTGPVVASLFHFVTLHVGTCYLGLAMSSLKEPVVKKVLAAGSSREHRMQHKDYFAEQALQMVMEHL